MVKEAFLGGRKFGVLPVELEDYGSVRTTVDQRVVGNCDVWMIVMSA